MEQPKRDPRPRRKNDIVTYEWVQAWVIRGLWALAAAGVMAIGAAWRVSAQVADLKRDVQEAQALGPLVTSLTNEVRLLRKGQDSLVTLMTDRERRPSNAPLTPLGPR